MYWNQYFTPVETLFNLARKTTTQKIKGKGKVTTVRLSATCTFCAKCITEEGENESYVTGRRKSTMNFHIMECPKLAEDRVIKRKDTFMILPMAT